MEQKNMNMISTGAFQTEMDASSKQPTIAEKFAAVWEKKNAKAARAGGVSLMALSLAACGSDDDTTATSTSTATTTTTSATGGELTNATDALTASGTISAGLVWSPGGDTRTMSLQSEDTVTGSGSADVINITSNGGTVAPKFTGVETVNFNVAGATAGTLNASNSTGITAIDLSSTDGNVGASGLGLGVALSAGDIADPATNAFFNMKSSAVLGTADAATVTVDGFLGTNLNIGTSAAATTAGTGIETLTLAASGETSSIASLGSTTASTVNVNATAQLTVSAFTATGITTMDASGSTATTSMNVGSNISANIFSYTGGSGADTIISASGFGGTDSLDGGDGADTFSVRPAAADGDVTVGALNADSASVFSNIETLDMRGTNGGGNHDFTVDMDHVPSVTAITMRAGDISNATVFNLDDLSAGQAGALTLSMNGTGATLAADATINLDLKDGSGTTDSATANVTITAHDTDNTVAGRANNQTITIDDDNNNVESLTVNLSGAYSSILAMDISSYATGITVTGGATGENLRVSTNVAATTVDMSGVASSVGDASNHLTTSGTTQTIKTGAGADYITMDTGAKTITTGAGNDWVDTNETATETSGGVAVADSIDGGAGTDTIVVDDILNATYAAGIKNFERLVVENDTGDTTPTHDMAVYTGSTFTVLRIDDAAADFTNVSSSVTQLEITANGATSAGLGRLVDTASDALDIEATANTGDIGTVTLSNEETLTFDAADGTMNMTLSAADVTSITVSGDNTVDLGTIAAATGLATVDATGLTGGADYIANMASSTSAMTVTAHTSATNTGSILNITTGSGADNITGGAGADIINGGAGIDTISGGGGADQITGGDGSDTLAGGAGLDKFFYVDTTVASHGGDTITDFSAAAGDEISVEIAVAGGATGTADGLVTITASGVGSAGVTNADLVVVEDAIVVDVSGNATADLSAINTTVQGSDGTADQFAANAEGLIIFNADTNGDGAADEIQVWYFHETGNSSSTADAASYVATLSNLSGTLDLTDLFGATNAAFTA